MIGWLLVEVALLLIGLSKILASFDHPSVTESPLRLRALGVAQNCKQYCTSGNIISLSFQER